MRLLIRIFSFSYFNSKFVLFYRAIWHVVPQRDVPDHSQLLSNKSDAAGATVLKTVGDESIRVEKVGRHEVTHVFTISQCYFDLFILLFMMDCLEDSTQDI